MMYKVHMQVQKYVSWIPDLFNPTVLEPWHTETLSAL